MQTWTDVGITIAYGATGEMRTTCPQCSASRRKTREVCLAVNVDQGALGSVITAGGRVSDGRRQVSTLPSPSPVPVQPDERKRAALRRIWGEACPITVADPVHNVSLHSAGSVLRQCRVPYRHALPSASGLSRRGWRTVLSPSHACPRR